MKGTSICFSICGDERVRACRSGVHDAALSESLAPLPRRLGPYARRWLPPRCRIRARLEQPMKRLEQMSRLKRWGSIGGEIIISRQGLTVAGRNAIPDTGGRELILPACRNRPAASGIGTCRSGRKRGVIRIWIVDPGHGGGVKKACGGGFGFAAHAAR
jgi:hypothetical protein